MTYTYFWPPESQPPDYTPTVGFYRAYNGFYGYFWVNPAWEVWQQYGGVRMLDALYIWWEHNIIGRYLGEV